MKLTFSVNKNNKKIIKVEQIANIYATLPNINKSIYSTIDIEWVCIFFLIKQKKSFVNFNFNYLHSKYFENNSNIKYMEYNNTENRKI